MTKMMKTFVMKRIGEVGFMDKPIPADPGPNDAIIKTTTALVCTSDVHTVKGEKAFWMMDSKEDNIIKPLIHFE